MSASPRPANHASRLEALRMELKETDDAQNKSNNNNNKIEDEEEVEVEDDLSDTAGGGEREDSDEESNSSNNNNNNKKSSIENTDKKHVTGNATEVEETNNTSHQHQEEISAEAGQTANNQVDENGKRRSRRLDANAISMSIQKPVRITEKYEIGPKLGRGHFAVVRRATSKLDGKDYAVKMISADFLRKDASLRDEIECLRRVGDFPYVVRLIELFEDHHGLYLVMDLCLGGDLFSRISKSGKYNEKKAAKCCRQLALAIQHIHHCGITHRDLKPENVLLVTEAPDSDIKIADFGLSKLLNDPASKMQTVCGTWAYCAPEVMEDKPYDMTVDNWTLGVLTFILLSGYHPFDTYGDLPEQDVIKNVRSVKYDFNDPVWNCISEEPKRLIKALLVLDPAGRLTTEEFLSSPWVAEPVMMNSDSPAPSPLANVPRRLGEIMESRNKIKSIVMAKIASKRLRRFLDKKQSVDDNNSPRSSFGSGSNSPFLSPRSPLAASSPKPVTPPFFNRSINMNSPATNRRELDLIHNRRKGSVTEELSPFAVGAPSTRRGSLGLPSIVPPASISPPISPTSVTPTAASARTGRRTSIVGIVTAPDPLRTTTPTNNNSLSISPNATTSISLNNNSSTNISTTTNSKRTTATLNLTNNLSAQFGATTSKTPTANILNPSPSHQKSTSSQPNTPSRFTGFTFGNVSAATSTGHNIHSSVDSGNHLIIGNNSAAAAASAAARKARRNTAINISALQITPAPTSAPVAQTPGTTHRRVISLDTTGISPRMAAFFGQNSPVNGISPRVVRPGSLDPTARSNSPSSVLTNSGNNQMASSSPQTTPRSINNNKRSLAISAALKLATE